MKRKKVWTFWGLSRSGTHSVMRWTLQNNGQPVVFLNNCSYNLKSLIQKRTAFFDGTEWKFMEKRVSVTNLKLKFDEIACSFEDSPYLRNFDVALSQLRRQCPALLECDIEEIEFKHVLVLRDPFNLYASRLKVALNLNVPTRPGGMDYWFRSIDNWINYASAFLIPSKIPEPFIPVKYNDWHINSAYRKKIAIQLGIGTQDEGKESVSPWGDGSSFSGVQLDGRAKELDSNNRWRWAFTHPEYGSEYKDLVINDSVFEISEQLFPEITQKVRKAVKNGN